MGSDDGGRKVAVMCAAAGALALSGLAAYYAMNSVGSAAGRKNEFDGKVATVYSCELFSFRNLDLIDLALRFLLLSSAFPPYLNLFGMPPALCLSGNSGTDGAIAGGDCGIPAGDEVNDGRSDGGNTRW